MTIETTFAIEAAPEAIWDALWAELALGEEGAFSVEGSAWPQRLVLSVMLGRILCTLTYTIERKDQGCEVTAVLDPSGFRYPIFQAFTLGHFGSNYKMMLATGLANLKTAVEPRKPEAEGESES